MKFEHVKAVQEMHEGNSLKSDRKKLGLTQQYIANKIGVSQPLVSSIEKSRTPYGYYGRRYREVLTEERIVLL
jgi:predicted transcriptional regulator